MDELLNFFSAVDNTPFDGWDLIFCLWLGIFLGVSGYRPLVRIVNYIDKKAGITPRRDDKGEFVLGLLLILLFVFVIVKSFAT